MHLDQVHTFTLSTSASTHCQEQAGEEQPQEALPESTLGSEVGELALGW